MPIYKLLCSFFLFHFCTCIHSPPLPFSPFIPPSPPPPPQSPSSTSVVLQLRNVLVQVQRGWIGEGASLRHLPASDHLLHRHLHLLAADSVLQEWRRTTGDVSKVNWCLNISMTFLYFLSILTKLFHFFAIFFDTICESNN